MSPDAINIDVQPYLEHEFYASVSLRDGKPSLTPTDPARWLATLSKLQGPVKLTIQRPRKRRSVEANAYYWAVVANAYYWAVVLVDSLAGLRQLAAEVGETCPFSDEEELHEAFKYMFLGVETIKVPGGGSIDRPSTTTTLNSKQFAAYIDSIKQWDAARGIYVREPGEEVSV